MNGRKDLFVGSRKVCVTGIDWHDWNVVIDAVDVVAVDAVDAVVAGVFVFCDS